MRSRIDASDVPYFANPSSNHLDVFQTRFSPGFCFAPGMFG